AGPILGYQPYNEACPGFIRLVGRSVPSVVEIMQDAGVLDDTPPPKFPEPPTRLDEERAIALWYFFEYGVEVKPPPTPTERQMLETFLTARANVQATRSQQPGKVPLFKFQFRCGCRVWPEECRLIADGLTRYLAANEGREGLGIDWSEVREWAAYNRVA